MGTDHNGKEVKPITAQNVRIAKHVYEKVRDFAWKKGYRIGAFFQTAALEKMKRETMEDKELKLLSKGGKK